MFKFLRNRKGVTLVEVLAVVVILGIIAAIAVPTIGNLIENQRRSAAETEWSNIEEAARLYATAENPGAAFTLDDIDTEGYIDTTGMEFSEDEAGETPILIADIDFDQNGNLTTAGPIYLDGFIVVPA